MRLTDLLTHKRGKNLFLPAHSRGSALPEDFKRLLKNKPGLWDLPELPDIGAPTSLGGAIALSQIESAEAIGAQKGWYGVNGATGLLQAGVLAMAKPKESILMPRNVHRSLIQACILGDLNPVLFDLPYLDHCGHFAPPNLTWFQEVLDNLHRLQIEISAVVLTHPSYQGYSGEIKPLIDHIHQNNLPVLVDEAHGTYFSFANDDSLPQSALEAGADLVVHSLHKSANGLSQTAAIWWQGRIVDPEILERSITFLQTTSPSALLLSSCESALGQWTSPSGVNQLNRTIFRAKEIGSELTKAGLPLLENDDPLKLILHTSSVGISGLKADEWFIKQRLIAELPEPGTITFCLGFERHRRLISFMKKMWEELLLSDLPRDSYPPFVKPPFSFLTIVKNEYLSSFRTSCELVDLRHSEGRIAADLISPYPPGVPILVPGELINAKLVDWMISQKTYWPEQIPNEILVAT